MYFIYLKANQFLVKKQVRLLLLLFVSICISGLQAQQLALDSADDSLSLLFRSEEILPVRMAYSQKVLKAETNDSTYMKTGFSYRMEDGSWDSLEIKVRTRGNWRLKNCYYYPVKVRVKKSVAKGTVFEGNKKLKMVLPCQQVNDGNDNVIKEFMAYKLYELVSPYHFKTRLLDIDFAETKGKKVKEHKIKGFFIEDIDKVADRHNANQLKRSVHPLQQDNICCVRNDFFQYMIGNTDFSVAYRHNEKLIFIEDKKAMPVPYDFDMSGLVNANYAVVSQVQNEVLEIESVTERLYRGFKRTDGDYNKVRQEFLENRTKFFEVVDGLEVYFENPREFEEARSFLMDFFKVLQDDSMYRREIVAKARSK